MVLILICKHRSIKLSKAEINPKYINKIMYECSIRGIIMNKNKKIKEEIIR